MLTKKLSCYFDLDATLIDDSLLRSGIGRLFVEMGFAPDKIEQAYAKLDGYSFEEHFRELGLDPDNEPERLKLFYGLLAHGDDYLLPEVVESLRRISLVADCALVTYGDPNYQSLKFAGINALQDIFLGVHYVWKKIDKGRLIADQGLHLGSFFLDNDPKHLLSVRAAAPWVRRARMLWPHLAGQAHEFDGVEWAVFHDLKSYADMIENAARYV